MAEPDPPARWRGVVLVTGTNTGVGKTVATAALAGRALAGGASVAVYKPAQTGVGAGEAGDIDEVGRLLGAGGDISAGGGSAVPGPLVGGPTAGLPGPRLTLREGVRLRDPLAPATAARREGRAIPTVAEHAHAVAALSADHDLVLVEGAGGLLVELDTAGGTLADLGESLRDEGIGPVVVLVCAAGLGTLNHTALTAAALRARGLPLLGVLVGAWPQPPAAPDLAMTENLVDLPRVAGARLLGKLPEGAGAMDAPDFARGIPAWLSFG